VDERQLHVEPGLLHGAHRLAELDHDRLHPLRNLEERQVPDGDQAA
jgi:hypothetical protein